MPTILRSGPYHFYFYSHEPNEPPHVHVDRENLSAKFWLVPVSLAQNQEFGAKSRVSPKGTPAGAIAGRAKSGTICGGLE